MPATALRRLFVNKETKTLQVSDRNGAPFVLPPFSKYETVPLAIVIVEPDLASGLQRFGRVDISPLSLTVSLHSSREGTATPLAQQASWSKDETLNVFSGELALNVAAMNTYVDADSVAIFLEIEWAEGTARSKAIIETTVEKAVTQPGSAGPASVTEYYTKAETNAQFVSKIMPAGEQLTLTSPNGLWQRIIGVGDGGETIDTVVAV